MKRFMVSILAVLALSLAMAVPIATASTEFGDNCTANEATESPITLFEISGAGNPCPRQLQALE